MSLFKAEWHGFDTLDADFSTLSKGMQGQAIRAALRAAAVPVRDAAIRHSPSRRVKQSLITVITGSGPRAIAKIGARKRSPGARILHLIDKGTKPHRIRIRRKRVLADRRRKRVFGRFLQHPGQRAQQFFSRALPDNEREAAEKYRRALRSIVNKMQLKLLKKRVGI